MIDESGGPTSSGPREDVLDDLVAQGLARPALRSPGGFAEIERAVSTVSTAEIIDDLRGPW